MAYFQNVTVDGKMTVQEFEAKNFSVNNATFNNLTATNGTITSLTSSALTSTTIDTSSVALPSVSSEVSAPITFGTAASLFTDSSGTLVINGDVDTYGRNLTAGTTTLSTLSVQPNGAPNPFNSSFSNYNTISADGTYGIAVKFGKPWQITSLGLWQFGLDNPASTRELGVWDTVTGNLLGSVTANVTQGASKVYVPITLPRFQANTLYTIGCRYLDGDRVPNNVITLVDDAIAATPHYTSSAFPSVPDQANPLPPTIPSEPKSMGVDFEFIIGNVVFTVNSDGINMLAPLQGVNYFFPNQDYAEAYVSSTFTVTPGNLQLFDFDWTPDYTIGFTTPDANTLNYSTTTGRNVFNIIFSVVVTTGSSTTGFIDFADQNFIWYSYKIPVSTVARSITINQFYVALGATSFQWALRVPGGSASITVTQDIGTGQYSKIQVLRAT